MPVLVGYLLWESIGLVEHWLGRASILLLAPFALVLLLYRSYRLLAIPNPSGRAVERSNGRREMTTRSTKLTYKATVALALVGILVAMLVGGYVGERPWVWDPAELVSWLLKLL
jgi:hypothetical protein